MESTRRWFILENNQVNGPYQTSEVEALVPTAVDPLIWGRGLSEWLPTNAWRESLKDPHLLAALSVDDRQWRYRYEGKEYGPVSFEDLMAVLKSNNDFAEFLVCNEIQKEWQELYMVAKICNELGISRRSHPRVPIMATLLCESTRGPITVKVISISEGGLGVSNAGTFKIGEKYKGLLTSSNLYNNINCMIEVMYVGAEGYAGLQFLSLPIEAKSAIISYIKKFKDLQK